MSLFGYDFRRHVFRASAEGVSSVTGILESRLDQAEIRDASVPIFIQKYVFWLQVAISNTRSMQVLKSKQYLSHIKLGHRLIHPLYSLQRAKKLSTRIVIHYKNEKILRLKRPV